MVAGIAGVDAMASENSWSIALPASGCPSEHKLPSQYAAVLRIPAVGFPIPATSARSNSAIPARFEDLDICARARNARPAIRTLGFWQCKATRLHHSDSVLHRLRCKLLTDSIPAT